MREWLPVWWEHQFRYEKMFLGAVAVSAVLQMVILFMRIMRKQKLRPQYVGVFMKQSLREPYYIMQKDYDEGSMESCEINGNKIYFSTGEEINSYHVFPGTCYKPMLERSTLIGDRIEDGFRAK